MGFNQSNQLGRIDRNIVRLLQRDARMTHTELARRVCLSTTPCKERVRRLEREGVIQPRNFCMSPLSSRVLPLTQRESSIQVKRTGLEPEWYSLLIAG